MKRILVVVDMQCDFIDGALGTKEACDILPAVEEKIKEYHSRGEEIVFTMDTHGENYLGTQEGKRLPVTHCIKGSSGWNIHPNLRPYAKKIFEKPGFGSKECAQYIASEKFDEVELIGLCTDICVISNAVLIKAFAPEATVKVDSRCCAGVTPESHQNALNALKMVQIDIEE